MYLEKEGVSIRSNIHRRKKTSTGANCIDFVNFLFYTVYKESFGKQEKGA